MGRADRRDPVVGPGREIHDHPVHVVEDGAKSRKGPDGPDLPATATHEIGQTGRPDEVVGQDRDPRGQRRISARWWKTSRAVTTPVGTPSWMIGMCRKPPTAILLMARAIGSS